MVASGRRTDREALGGGYQAAFWGAGSVLYRDRDEGYMDVSMCQNWWNYPVKILLCMPIPN